MSEFLNTIFTPEKQVEMLTGALKSFAARKAQEEVEPRHMGSFYVRVGTCYRMSPDVHVSDLTYVRTEKEDKIRKLQLQTINRELQSEPTCGAAGFIILESSSGSWQQLGESVIRISPKAK